MLGNLAQIAARAFNTPLLIHPRKAEVIASVLADRIGIAPMLDIAAAQSSGDPFARTDGRSNALNRFDGEPRGPKITTRYGDTVQQTRYLFRDGLALITVEGTLVNRGAWIGASSGATSYEGVQAQLASAAADRDVREIVLDLESPGGEAIGAFEMAEFVRGIAAEKPVTAFVNGMAASAAYAMASGATRILTTPSGISGSIGVVMLHLDRSGEMAKRGIKPTLIFAGDHKVDGHPFDALSEDVRAELQGEIDHLYTMFVDTVAQGRASMSADSIRATQARTFIGADAVAIGLADGISSLAEIVTDSTTRFNAARRGSLMSNTDTIARADHDSAVATARAEGEKAGAAAERTRIAGILGHASAKGRESLAQHFAFESAMTAEQAVAALEKVPEAKPAAASPLAAAMAAQPAANLGPGGERAAPSTASAWDRAVAKVNSRLV